MTKQLSERDWTEVHQTLDEYYAHEHTFDSMVEEALAKGNRPGTKILMDWFGEQDRLRLECGKAFVRATADINGTDAAYHVSLSFVEKCSSYREMLETRRLKTSQQKSAV